MEVEGFTSFAPLLNSGKVDLLFCTYAYVYTSTYVLHVVRYYITDRYVCTHAPCDALYMHSCACTCTGGHVHYYHRFMPYDSVAKVADSAAVSADGAVYTNPKVN